MTRSGAPLYASSHRDAYHRAPADHGRHNAAPLDKVDLSLKDRGHIAIEPHNEPWTRPAACMVWTAATGRALFWTLLHSQPLLIGRLVPTKTIEPARTMSPSVQIINQIDRNLRLEPKALRLPPRDQCGKYVLFEIAFVADQIIIDEKHASTPTA